MCDVAERKNLAGTLLFEVTLPCQIKLPSPTSCIFSIINPCLACLKVGDGVACINPCQACLKVGDGVAYKGLQG